MFPLRFQVSIKADKPRPIEEGVIIREDNVRKAALEKFSKDAEKMVRDALRGHN